ncbi:Far1 dna binding domain [Thalictrum thalictroides]|uniref:Far1 dna binding domain n=1 Tax=Thalictrum thalictroides TaxID=46969 RepID=A0A7J6WYT6_THATH|nr:Far1 dna binding domain [Thalictrum thalictroides]
MFNCDTMEFEVQTLFEEFENSYAPHEGQVFQTLDEAKEFYRDYGRVMGFGTTIRSTQKIKRGIDKPDTCVLSCERYGHHKKVDKPQDNNFEKSVGKKRNTSTIKCGCKAQLRLSKMDDDKWIVVKFDKTHNHNFVTPSKRFRMRINRSMPKGAKDSGCQSFRRRRCFLSDWRVAC